MGFGAAVGIRHDAQSRPHDAEQASGQDHPHAGFGVGVKRRARFAEEMRGGLLIRVKGRFVKAEVDDPASRGMSEGQRRYLETDAFLLRTCYGFFREVVKNPDNTRHVAKQSIRQIGCRAADEAHSLFPGFFV